jgi:hypothetical protein
MPTDKTKNYVWTRKRTAAKSCARGSIRTVKQGDTLFRVCCPKGEWKNGSCRVGMRLQAIGKPIQGHAKRALGVAYPLVKNIKKVTLK